jgi:hypothetical protein
VVKTVTGSHQCQVVCVALDFHWATTSCVVLNLVQLPDHVCFWSRLAEARVVRASGVASSLIIDLMIAEGVLQSVGSTLLWIDPLASPRRSRLWSPFYNRELHGERGNRELHRDRGNHELSHWRLRFVKSLPSSKLCLSDRRIMHWFSSWRVFIICGLKIKHSDRSSWGISFLFCLVV